MALKDLTHDIYHFALSKLEQEKAKLEELIAHIRTQVGTSILPDAATTPEAAPVAKAKKATRKKRVMSAEAKEKVSLAQKARWDAFHEKQKAQTDMLAKLERNAKKAVKKVTKKAVTKASKTKWPVVAVKKAAKKATKKTDNSDIPF